MNAENEEEAILVTEWERKEDVIDVVSEATNKETVQLDHTAVHQDQDQGHLHTQAEVPQEEEEEDVTVTEEIKIEERIESTEVVTLDQFLDLEVDPAPVLKRAEAEAKIARVDLFLKVKRA